MDDLVYTALVALFTGDPYDQRVYQVGSLGRGDTPAEPTFPYCMYGGGVATPFPRVQGTAPGASFQTYRVTLYDTPGSFVRIKADIKRVRQTMLGLVGMRDLDGVQLTAVKWTGNGDDAYEQVQDANIKLATFQIVARA